jgi:toxin ParE1/3/4
LSKIWNYTYKVWSESQADKYYQLLTDSFDLISQNPEIGKKYDKVDKAVLGLRAGKPIVFYRVAKSDEIEILRVLHQSMDLKNRMEK